MNTQAAASARVPVPTAEPELALASAEDKAHLVARVKADTRGHDKLFRLSGLAGADRNDDSTISRFEYGLYKLFNAVWDRLPTSWKDGQIRNTAESNADKYESTEDFQEMLELVDAAFTTQKLHALNVLDRSDANGDGRISRAEHAGFKLSYAAESWAIKNFPSVLDAAAEEVPVRKPE